MLRLFNEVGEGEKIDETHSRYDVKWPAFEQYVKAHHELTQGFSRAELVESMTMIARELSRGPETRMPGREDE
jgi:hypothetical protein